MFGAAIIVLRESLEAALLIGIVAAATRALPNRNRWIVAGIAAGLFGATVVAGLTGQIAEWADGIGQELFNTAILAIAVAMLAWHNIWMASHAKEMVQEVRGVANSVTAGLKDLSAIAVIIAMTVLREGSETVLFLYGMLATSGDISGIALGGALGLLGGGALGAAMYIGLVKIPVRWFFSATAGLVLLVAAGMASQMARLLIQADLLSPLQTPIWDTSSWIPQESPIGTFLHALMGYEAQPTGMQCIFYVTTLLAILGGMYLARQPARAVAPQ